MKKWTLPALVLVALFLLLPGAAQALFLCEDCLTPTQPGLCLNLSCAGVPRHTTCAVYLANNCPVLQWSPAESAKEAFLLSLEAQAVSSVQAEPVEVEKEVRP